MKEFNLSEKITKAKQMGEHFWESMFFRKDVKEFIRRLKENVYKKHKCGFDCEFEEEVEEMIDKLAGDDLI